MCSSSVQWPVRDTIILSNLRLQQRNRLTIKSKLILCIFIFAALTVTSAIMSGGFRSPTEMGYDLSLSLGSSASGQRRPPPSYIFSPRSVTPSSEFSDDSFRSGVQLPLPAKSTPVHTSSLRSAVWNYFHKDSDDLGDFSTCKVVLPNNEICGARKSRHIQVLKNHLKNEHPEFYDQVNAEDAENQRKRNEQKVLKALQESGKGKGRKYTRKAGVPIYGAVPELAKYSKEDARQKILDETVAIFIGGTNTPFSIVDNDLFRIMMGTFDPRYRIPGHDHLSSVINNVITKMKSKIQQAMASARKINFCADIWSKKGLTSSYLGLTAHFFSFTDQKLHHPTLAVRQLDHPHTGEAISTLTYAIIEEWGIPLSKLQFIVTDNGSNMLKAFKIVQSVNDDEEILDELANEDEESGDEVCEFEQQENNSSEAFKQLASKKPAGLQRVSCFNHTLQLVVAKFTKDANCKEILLKVNKIVKSVNHSGKATETLIKEGGKKLVSSCVSRWSTTYLVIHRLLEVKEPLKKVLLEFNMTMFQPEEWEALESIDRLLSKFATYTNIAGGENYPSLSMVIPSFLELEVHLNGLLKLPVIGNVSNILLQELYARFSKLLDFQHIDHHPVYVIATLLDPRYKTVLDDNHVNYAKKEFLKMIDPEVDLSSDDNIEQLSETEPPDPKKPCLFPFVYELMSKKAHHKKESRNNPSLYEVQLENYVRSTEGSIVGEDSNPLLFWATSNGYSDIAPFAISILSAPSASTAVERTFSTAGEATSGKRNRLTGANLEKEVLLRKNKIYYSCAV